jgi:hypothetical protein
MPITSEDEQYFGPMMKEICETHDYPKTRTAGTRDQPRIDFRPDEMTHSGITPTQTSYHIPQNT